MFTFLAKYVCRILELIGATPPGPLKVPAHPELSSIGVANYDLPAKYEGTARSLNCRTGGSR